MMSLVSNANHSTALKPTSMIILESTTSLHVIQGCIKHCTTNVWNVTLHRSIKKLESINKRGWQTKRAIICISFSFFIPRCPTGRVLLADSSKQIYAIMHLLTNHRFFSRVEGRIHFDKQQTKPPMNWLQRKTNHWSESTSNEELVQSNRGTPTLR